LSLAINALAKPVGTIALAFALAALAMLVAGVSPTDGFWAIFAGALGGRRQIAETLVQMTALLFPSLGVALAFRAGLFNIGAEGQLLIGGLVAGALGAHTIGPATFSIIVVLVAGFIAGGVWGGIAGWMRARFNASEIISTLMLNFIAFSLASGLVSGPLKDPQGSGAQTAPLAPQSWLPALLPDTRLSISLLIAIAFAFALRWLLGSTIFGYELRATGDGPQAAQRAGVNIRRVTWIALAMSGAIAGLGGAAIVSGVFHRFNTQLSAGYGYTAIAVALVGELDPLWICVAAFGFGILEAGGVAMQALVDVPKDAIHVIEGCIVLFLAVRRYIATRANVAAI
jgi:general nucleoside transport system permease protein